MDDHVRHVEVAYADASFVTAWPRGRSVVHLMILLPYPCQEVLVTGWMLAAILSLLQ